MISIGVEISLNCVRFPGCPYYFGRGILVCGFDMYVVCVPVVGFLPRLKSRVSALNIYDA
jgi:hypothetical protein